MARSKKSLKKIKGLIFLMLITVVFGITATYAWFSTQRDVEIAGMRLNVEVAESMQISLDGEKWTQSIKIADMRQFYGTYNNASGSIFQAKDIDGGGNLNYVPTELKPVSTAGEVSEGKLQFVQGTIGTNADGSQSLTGITACSEADITTTATIANKEANNEEHPYLVFDMYLRNISAKTEGIDELLLNAGSSVYIEYRPMMREQEGRGNKGTGLEYSARVGMIVYGNTVSVTAEDTPSQTVGEQVRAISPNNSEVVAIWEPNYLEHTQYVVNNNGRGITSTSQLVTTYGIKSAVATSPKTVANVNASTDVNSDGIEDTNENLVAVNTFKPEYESTALIDDMLLISGQIVNILEVKNESIITNIEGNTIGLAPNQISKVRVYIWLEGQDPDCIDMASTGDRLNINLKLTKGTNTIVENSYNKEFTGKAPIEKGNTITAETLVGYERTEYGAYVTNYESINETTNGASLDWRIFHTDGENIYLITDNPIDKQYRPAGKNGTPYTYPNSNYLMGPPNDYTGLTDISSEVANKLFDQIATSGITNTSEHGRATAYMLDATVWSNFKDSTGYAKFAVGGPTMELFAESYNKIYYIDINTRASGKGYQIKLSNAEWQARKRNKRNRYQ